MSHHGVKVDYEYDGLGRKTKISLNGEEYVSYEYDDNYDNEDLDVYEVECTKVKYGNQLINETIYNDKSQVSYEIINIHVSHILITGRNLV